MKKILFFAAAVAVVALASCGKGEKGEAVDSDTVVAVEQEVAEGVDSLGDTVAAVATEAVEAVVPAAEQPAK